MITWRSADGGGDRGCSAEWRSGLVDGGAKCSAAAAMCSSTTATAARRLAALDRLDDRRVPIARHHRRRLADRVAVHDRHPDAALERAPGARRASSCPTAGTAAGGSPGRPRQVLREVAGCVGEVGERACAAWRPRSSRRGEAMISVTARPSSAARTWNSSRTSAAVTGLTRSIPRLPAVTRPSCWRWRSASRTVPRLTPRCVASSTSPRWSPGR